MTFSEGALRLGVLYDLLGRYHHEDLREATVEQFMQRYEVDRAPGGARRRTAAGAAAARCCREAADAEASDAQIPALGGAPARDRHIGGALELSQAQRLHPRQRRHAGLFQDATRRACRAWCWRTAASWSACSRRARRSARLDADLRLAPRGPAAPVRATTAPMPPVHAGLAPRGFELSRRSRLAGAPRR